MPTERYLVKLTRNFEHNLDEIERFLEENKAAPAFDRLLDELTDTVIPNLERFPKIGRPFLDRPASSLEAAHRIEQLRAKLGAIGSGGELREYISTNHLVLYAVIETTVHLLSIRHHRQLSFDFEDRW